MPPTRKKIWNKNVRWEKFNKLQIYIIFFDFLILYHFSFNKKHDENFFSIFHETTMDLQLANRDTMACEVPARWDGAASIDMIPYRDIQPYSVAPSPAPTTMIYNWNSSPGSNNWASYVKFVCWSIIQNTCVISRTYIWYLSWESKYHQIEAKCHQQRHV